MVARYKKKTHNSGQLFSLIGLISIIIVVFAAIVIYLINYVFFKQDIDYTKNKEGTLCPLINNKPLPDGHAVILIDVTDKLDKIQKRSILNEIDRIVEKTDVLYYDYGFDERFIDYYELLVLAAIGDYYHSYVFQYNLMHYQ